MAKWGERDSRWIVENRSDGRNVNNWHWTTQDITKVGLEYLKTTLCKSSKHNWADDPKLFNVFIDAVEQKGDVNINTRKQRAFLLYDLQLIFYWRAAFKAQEVVVTGKTIIPKLESDEENFEIRVEMAHVPPKIEVDVIEHLYHYVYNSFFSLLTQQIPLFLNFLSDFAEKKTNLTVGKSVNITENDNTTRHSSSKTQNPQLFQKGFLNQQMPLHLNFLPEDHPENPKSKNSLPKLVPSKPKSGFFSYPENKQSELASQFWDSCSQGNIEALQKFVQQHELEGKSLENFVNNNGFRFLFPDSDHFVSVAAGLGHEEILQFLLSKKATLDKKNIHEMDALHMACSAGHVNIVKLLLNEGMAIDSHDKTQNTPLHHATAAGATELVKLLIEKKANANQQNQQGLTPLHTVFYCQDSQQRLETVEALLTSNADINIIDNESQSAIHLAITSMENELVSYLLKQKADPNLPDKNGQTALLIACEQNDLNVIQLLIDAQANINQGDPLGITPLMVSCDKRDLKAVELLVQHNADVNARDTNGFTPIYNGAAVPELVDFLVKHGANEDDVEGPEISNPWDNHESNTDQNSLDENSLGETSLEDDEEGEEEKEVLYVPKSPFWGQFIYQSVFYSQNTTSLVGLSLLENHSTSRF